MYHSYMEHTPDMIFSGKFYNRTMHESGIKLSNILKIAYNAKYCSITSSGMAAISTILNVLTLKHTNINIIYAHELYCDTPDIITRLRDEKRIKNHYMVDITDNKHIIDTITEVRTDTNILFVESCSNPSAYIMDFSIIPKLRKLTTLYLVVDNTWLTYLIFNPFTIGADFVVNSLTKYYSAGSCIAGCILHNDDTIINMIYRYQKYHGSHTSPYNCELVINNIASLKQRLSTQSELTKRILPIFNNTLHPNNPKHVSYNLANTYFNKEYIIPLFAFMIPYKLKIAEKKMKRSGITYLTSYGGPISKFDSYPEQIGNETRCRLYIGYEDDYESLSSKLIKLLDTMTHPNHVIR
jgi:cystathionine beta-lyase/cystathionine gamma-synthase